ncbi:hypothetical protein V1264_003659 [Littorina saxatilis]|uniref:Uncharacterized protein n=1 Tax=Littorina saxatilis TaxID=31220 RepID=A0AAN9B6I2_9CAEN
MLPGAEMDQNVLGTLEDNINIDDNIFNLNLDFGNNSVSPNDQDNCFNWVDEFISSTELEDAQESASNGSATSTSQSVNVQQITAQQQQLLQNAVLQQQQQQAAAGSQAQQQQTHSLGNVIMAMGQPSQNVAASSASVSQAQLLHNQATILPSSLAGQQLGSSFILKTSSGQHVQLKQSPVTQSTSNISASPQQFLMSRSLTPSQSSSPLLSRSMTPSHTLTSSVGQPQVSVSAASNLNFLQLQQSQQMTQQVQLSNFVAGQQNLQGHAVLAAQGSNIVHTQNALIQNPNVVNVNVAHVLPNQLPQLQGTILQTPQGKILIQPNNQQLTLSNLSQMTGGQAVQMAPGVGLGQQTVIAQQPGNVNLGEWWEPVNLASRLEASPLIPPLRQVQ